VIKIATRNTPTSPFSNVRVLDEVSNTTADDTTPAVAQDGTEIFFTSTREGGNGHLFHSVRTLDGFAAPTSLSELVSGTARDSQTALSADGLTIFFGSDRTGGLGQSDVWTATRATKTAAFANVTHLDGPVNTATIEWPTWVSADGCRLYLGVLNGSAGDIVVAARGK
jgi:Tol biopolymer transport system component